MSVLIYIINEGRICRNMLDKLLLNQTEFYSNASLELIACKMFCVLESESYSETKWELL